MCRIDAFSKDALSLGMESKLPLVRGDCTLLKRRSSNPAQWRHLRDEMQERAHAGGGFSSIF